MKKKYEKPEIYSIRADQSLLHFKCAAQAQLSTGTYANTNSCNCKAQTCKTAQKN